MPTALNTQRIPPEILAEQWFGFLHSMIAGMQTAYREAQLTTPGLNQQVIAQRIGKKASFVSRCLSGQQNMTSRTIHDIGRGMGYRPEILFQALASVTPANQNKVASLIEHPTPSAGAETVRFYVDGPLNPAASGSIPRIEAK
jgi:hypothetical protein